MVPQELGRVARAGPCLARMRDQIDHIDFSMIAEMQIASHDDELDLRFMFGPTWGIPVRCRVKNLTTTPKKLAALLRKMRASSLVEELQSGQPSASA